MPRVSINYKNTVVYKIVCNDLNITDVYVGHTTDFTRRNSEHKTTCNNEKLRNYNLNIYKIIRANGGYSNWTMVQIETFSCNNSLEARTRERYYYELLNARMNSVKPFITETEIIERNKLITKQYRITNADIIKEKKKEVYELNKETILKEKKINYLENKEIFKNQTKLNYTKNKDEINRKQKLRRETNRDEINRKQNLHRAENKDEINKKEREKYNKKIKIYRQINKEEVNRKNRLYYDLNKKLILERRQKKRLEKLIISV